MNCQGAKRRFAHADRARCVLQGGIVARMQGNRHGDRLRLRGIQLFTLDETPVSCRSLKAGDAPQGPSSAGQTNARERGRSGCCRRCQHGHACGQLESGKRDSLLPPQKSEWNGEMVETCRRPSHKTSLKNICPQSRLAAAGCHVVPHNRCQTFPYIARRPARRRVRAHQVARARREKNLLLR